MDRLTGYSPWGRKESDRTERLTLKQHVYEAPRHSCCLENVHLGCTLSWILWVPGYLLLCNKLLPNLVA